MAVDLDELEPMSQNAFAKFAGVSAKTASQWKSKGYLTFTNDGLVDAKSSTIDLMARGLGKFEELDEGKTPDDEGVTSDEGNTSKPQEVTPAIQEAITKIVASIDDNMLSYAESERVKKYYEAMRERIDYETEIGKVVDKAEVEILFSKILSSIRTSWENWPASVCEDMAQELGVKARKLRIVLERYVRSQIEDYVRDIEDEDGEDSDDESED